MNILFLACMCSCVPELSFGASSAGGRTAAWLSRVQTRIVCMSCLFGSSNKSGQNGLHAQYLLYVFHVEFISVQKSALSWAFPRLQHGCSLSITFYVSGTIFSVYCVYSHGSKSQTLGGQFSCLYFPLQLNFLSLPRLRLSFCQHSADFL